MSKNSQFFLVFITYFTIIVYFPEQVLDTSGIQFKFNYLFVL